MEKSDPPYCNIPSVLEFSNHSTIAIHDAIQGYLLDKLFGPLDFNFCLLLVTHWKRNEKYSFYNKAWHVFPVSHNKSLYNTSKQ